MASPSGTAETQAQPSAAACPGEQPGPERLGPAAVLLLALWIGLLAGFVDLVILIIRKNASGHGFYRLGNGFPWIVPSGVAAIVTAAGAVVALFAWLRRRPVSLANAVRLVSFVAYFDLCAKLPLEFWSSLILSAGLALQSARFLRRRQQKLIRLARVSTPLLASLVLALALATTGARAWAEHRTAAALPPPPVGARNVLLIVWDTVRARNTSLHGYDRPTTPNLERLAASGVQFAHAFATSSWTLTSHASLFTGRWPHELSAGWESALDDAHPTLAGHLTSLGYDTAGFVANLDYCGFESGLGRGFAHYEDYPLSAWEVFTRYVGLGRRIDAFSTALVVEKLARRSVKARPLLPISREHVKNAASIGRAFLDWLSWQRGRGRPFFAFLNYNDAHSPYEVPDDSARGFGVQPESWSDRLVFHMWNTLDKAKLTDRQVQMANDLYDDSIAYLDRRLGALVGELRRRGALENTVLIVTSDHGEHLGDHQLFFHGCSLYRQVVEVPLVIVGHQDVPAGRVVTEPVSLRDLSSTVLDVASLGGSNEFPGRSLRRFWDLPAGKTTREDEPLLMETDRPPILINQGREPVAKGPMNSLVYGGTHYIRSGDDTEQLYALEVDPEEVNDAAPYPQAQETLEHFRDALPALLRPNAGVDARTKRPVAARISPGREGAVTE
jgi:arylsulfatase A-like enzyme